ncbi:MAG: MotA/TolQ/ExbB proton channel family protein [Pseudomonadota bacterium]|nr:MotA/TolQ/ExbB proton channel family protein [Pseudomonadota bacterium]
MTLAASRLPDAPDISAAWDPVLRWMIFTGVSLFTLVVLWRYGLIRLMVASDRTYISSVISALYVAASLHCLGRAIAVSRETVSAARWRDGGAAPPGLVSDHLRDLAAKARARGPARLDQTLLARAFGQRLQRGQALGALASDSVMKLGLLGTIIGFILMLGPIAGLDGDDPAAMRAAMGVMGDGMAVAMYTTLAGLIGSILLKAQYFMVERAAASLFWDVVRHTETRFLPALERGDV